MQVMIGFGLSLSLSPQDFTNTNARYIVIVWKHYFIATNCFMNERKTFPSRVLTELVEFHLQI